MILKSLTRERVMFYGRVQGIGFRYRLKYAASDRDLTGWVRNRYDGSVEAEIQGDRDAITDLIKAMAGIRFIRIDGIKRTEIPLEEGEYHFRIESY